MIRLRHEQPSLWHRGLAKDIEGLWEPWMQLVDERLEDEQLLAAWFRSRTEMENWFRRPYPHTQTKARVAPLFGRGFHGMQRWVDLGNRRQPDSDGTLPCHANYVASSCSALS